MWRTSGGGPYLVYPLPPLSTASDPNGSLNVSAGAI